MVIIMRIEVGQKYQVTSGIDKGSVIEITDKYEVCGRIHYVYEVMPGGHDNEYWFDTFSHSDADSDFVKCPSLSLYEESKEDTQMEFEMGARYEVIDGVDKGSVIMITNKSENSYGDMLYDYEVIRNGYKYNGWFIDGSIFSKFLVPSDLILENRPIINAPEKENVNDDPDSLENQIKDARRFEHTHISEPNFGLRPCPFCGSDKLKIKKKATKRNGMKTYVVSVRCNVCHARGGAVTDTTMSCSTDNSAENEAILRWNRRANGGGKKNET